MSSLALNIIYTSLAIAGLMGIACLADLVAGVPFGGQSTFDILFLISAGITAYMGVDCIRNSA